MHFDLKLEQAPFLSMLAFNKFRWFPVSLNAEFDLQIASLCFLWRRDECTVDTHIRISRHAEADRQHLRSSCLIKRFVCVRESDGPGTLLLQRGISSINFSFHYSISCGPIGGSTYWWPLLSSVSMTKVNILLDYLFHSLSHSLPPFNPLSSPSLPPSHPLSHSLHLDSVSFFRLRDESLPTAPFTPPEAAQMR